MTGESGSSSKSSQPSARTGMNPLVLILLLSGGFFLVFLLISSMLFMSGSKKDEDDEVAESLFSKKESIAIVEVKGVIMDSKKVLKRLRWAKKKKSVKGVVVRLETPGGSVAPSQEIYEAVKAFPKPLVVSMGSVAASGGYYIACGAKKVFANAGTLTGSIGVIMGFSNMEKLYEWAKIKPFAIKTGRYKDSGAAYRQMQPDERELLQEMIDDVLVQFKAAVKDGRGLRDGEVDAVSDGRILTGSQAKKAKLVDEIGTIQDAIKAVAEEAGIEGEPKVIYPRGPRRRFIEYLFDDREDDEARTPLESLGRLLFGNPETVNRFGESLKVAITPGVYWLWNGTY